MHRFMYVKFKNVYVYRVSHKPLHTTHSIQTSTVKRLATLCICLYNFENKYEISSYGHGVNEIFAFV